MVVERNQAPRPNPCCPAGGDQRFQLKRTIFQWLRTKDLSPGPRSRDSDFTGLSLGPRTATLSSSRMYVMFHHGGLSQI